MAKYSISMSQNAFSVEVDIFENKYLPLSVYEFLNISIIIILNIIL